ncbi:MAG TPA: glycoside hydrolase family 3 C-terminal domain-containing protein, partial [Candidatus Acidoferrales bacterium]|nr:glycoside hydrolase family 3 C-terminal domain-containing protein [Candidatus Acidoferrales bacterium]
LTFWSPNINIFRDPRWGRGQETYGEDPYLTARMAVAFVEGMQGDDPHYLKTVSTPKHFAVHSGPEVLRHRFDVPVSAHDFADTYTPAFRAAFVEAHADSVMCAYNSVRGAPACTSPLLYDSLRDNWKFAGYAVSDCGAISDIFDGHGYVVLPEQAAALAVKAGTDLTCGNEYRALSTAVRDRLISIDDINRAVERLFTARFRLGMFDSQENVPWSRLTLADNDTADHRKLALETARESIVLLKNDRGALPLKSSVKTIAVVGPTADSLDVLLGNYSGTPSRYTTILEGIRARFGAANVIAAREVPLTETDSIPIASHYFRSAGTGSPPGLKAEYFNIRDLSGPAAATRVDSQLNFSWDRQPPAPGVDSLNFSARWSGELMPPETGAYRIAISAAGGYRLFLDGQRVLDNWQRSHSATSATEVSLEGGRAYKIVLEYFSAGDRSHAKLSWSAAWMNRDAAVAAKRADAIVAVIGITPNLEGEETDVNAPGFFGGDRVDLDLPRPQRELLEQLAGSGKPLIVVLTGGSALAVNWAQEHAAAILDAWYPGEEGGTAVADVLAGDFNAAGRLPVTFYSGVSQLPPFTEYSMEGRTYRYFRGTPLYPFGFGLSYTNFSYTNARADRAEISAGDSLTVTADVQNTGSVAGDEVVEVYVSHPELVGAPIRSLAAFQRVHLDRGEKKTLSLTLRDRELSVVDEDGKRRVPEGPLEIWIGGGQPVPGQAQKAPPGALVKARITGETVLPN